MIRRIIVLLNLVPLIVFSQVQIEPKHAFGLNKIMLPAGYRIEVYASGLANAREMDFADDGTLFAGSMKEGKVYAIRPDRSVIIIDDSLEMPAGLDYYNGDLYVSAVSRMLKYENILQTLNSSPEPSVINSNFPEDTVHGEKFIRVGPDGKLYIAVGAPCNACIPDKKWYARIMRMSLDGKLIEYYAEGVRYTGGFDWDPATHVLWFTENGKEGLGDNFPPDELNKALVDGLHYGFPYFNGNMPDAEFIAQRPKNMSFINPAKELPAHVAPLGMRFYTGKMFDEKYHGGIFIAEHGSSDRSKKTGYRISFVAIDKNGLAEGYEIFASGWLQGETAWGRPADVQVGPDGSLFVSDDLKGCIYRIFK
jgi:glucose/arabinose dehydrogenase